MSWYSWDETLKMRWRPAGYGAALAPDHYEVGTLAVDFVAARLNRAVWMGAATKALPIKNPEKDIDKACEKLVKQFDKDVKAQQKKR